VLGEVFGAIRPAATALICGLVDPRMKIEIEVTARRGSALDKLLRPIRS
jgi:enamine deaminase RidA (YjgF/YER057c/UK114 family)